MGDAFWISPARGSIESRACRQAEQRFHLFCRVHNDGRQYVAVSTGLGGGSPRVVPSLIAPDIRHPATGNALYVFALPED